MEWSDLVAVVNQLGGNRLQEGSEVSGVAEIQVKIVDNDKPASGRLSAGRACRHKRGGGNDSNLECVSHVHLDGAVRRPA